MHTFFLTEYVNFLLITQEKNYPSADAKGLSIQMTELIIYILAEVFLSKDTVF